LRVERDPQPVRPGERTLAQASVVLRRSTLQTVFERFNERARQVVVLAQDEARALRHNYIGTEHILLGLLREEEGLAARVLGFLGIALEEVRARVVRIVGQGDEVTTGQIPFTPRAKKVLELALREALSLGHLYIDTEYILIDTEHILLGLLRENEGVAARILLDFDTDAEKIREEIIRTIGAPGPRQTNEGFPPEEDSAIELGLRRVVPVAQQMSDGTWVVSVEVWDHGLVVRLRTPHQPPPEHLSWLVSDDVGTSYTRSGAGGGWEPRRGFEYNGEFDPAPPPEATSLRIRREGTGDDLSISLTD
jgi:ATP-dependent Clp protease ATP-binding subunit ClpA